LAVHLFHGRLTLGDMDRLDAFGMQWRRKNPGKIVEMSIILPSEARMDREELARMAQIIKRWEGHRHASATVILAAGTTGALHRSLLTGLLLMAAPPHPSKVFSTVRDAVVWLWPYLRKMGDFEATPDEVVAGIDVFCAAFQERR